MLSIFKKLFGKSEPKAAAPAARPSPLSEPSAPMPSVEVAHLSLAAIVGRFPDELKSAVLQEPDAAATIALPLALIHRQLATGAVKMSFASLHRQAPPGVFGPIIAGDKRQVEIPLREIFRHVSPNAFKRRLDQRPLDTLDNDFNLFGNSEKPYEIAPNTPENPPRKDSTALHFKPASPAPASRVGFHEPPAPRAKPSGIAPSNGMRIVAPPQDFQGLPPAVPAPVAKSDEPPLTLPLASLVGAWPETLCGEIATLDPATTVTLDAGVISAGLAKGKVTFTWGEIRDSLQPAPAEPTSVDAGTMLVLPLKIIAPAYLAASKKKTTARKSIAMDDSIPALFNDGRDPATTEAVAPPAEYAPEDPVLEPVPQPEAIAVSAVEPEVPETVGQIFGNSNQQEFTPAEIVAGTVKLPGVAGAIVALQEGLPVAHSLPEGVKSEVIAAFLPQIFARLNQYSGEMKLGEVDDLLFTTHGAHCQIYRLGFVYFAVLGKPGESLPWHEMRIISAELARQTHK